MDAASKIYDIPRSMGIEHVVLAGIRGVTNLLRTTCGRLENIYVHDT